MSSESSLSLSWNIAAFPEGERLQKMLEVVNLEEDDLISIMENSKLEHPSEAMMLLEVLLGMIQIKYELYPNDDRVVIDFWFESEKGEEISQVKAIMPNPS